VALLVLLIALIQLQSSALNNAWKDVSVLLIYSEGVMAAVCLEINAVIPLLLKVVRLRVNNVVALRHSHAPLATHAWMIHVTTVIPKGMALIVAAFASAIVLALLWIALHHQRTAIMLILSSTRKVVK